MKRWGPSWPLGRQSPCGGTDGSISFVRKRKLTKAKMAPPCRSTLGYRRKGRRGLAADGWLDERAAVGARVERQEQPIRLPGIIKEGKMEMTLLVSRWALAAISLAWDWRIDCFGRSKWLVSVATILWGRLDSCVPETQWGFLRWNCSAVAPLTRINTTRSTWNAQRQLFTILHRCISTYAVLASPPRQGPLARLVTFSSLFPNF